MDFNRDIELSQAEEIARISYQQVVKHTNFGNQELRNHWGIILNEATKILKKPSGEDGSNLNSNFPYASKKNNVVNKDKSKI